MSGDLFGDVHETGEPSLPGNEGSDREELLLCFERGLTFDGAQLLGSRGTRPRVGLPGRVRLAKGGKGCLGQRLPPPRSVAPGR